MDADATLTALRELRAQRRRRRTWGRSRLVRYRAELVALRCRGASYGELALWLAGKRVKVARSTIQRYLAKLPELQETRHVPLVPRPRQAG